MELAPSPIKFTEPLAKNETAINGHGTFLLLKNETAAQKNRSEYMRAYMSKKYKLDPQSARKYRNTCRARNINSESLSEDDIIKYGIHLADILKLKKIISAIPKEFVVELIETSN